MNVNVGLSWFFPVTFFLLLCVVLEEAIALIEGPWAAGACSDEDEHEYRAWVK